MMDELEDMSIEALIMNGIIEIAAVDQETGEFLYTFTNKVKEKMPELYKAHMQSVHSEIMFFWEKGFVNLTEWDSPNPIVSLTEKSFDNESLLQLSVEKRQILEELKRILKVL